MSKGRRADTKEDEGEEPAFPVLERAEVGGGAGAGVGALARRALADGVPPMGMS